MELLKGRYQIKQILGQNTSFITYLAADMQDRCDVVIKEYFPVELISRVGSLLDGTCVTEVKDKARFEKAVNAVKRQAERGSFGQFAGVRAVRDHFDANQTIYLVRAYEKGKTLETYLNERQQPVSVDMAFEMLEPVIRSLALLHSHHICHGHINPSNLIINEAFEVCFHPSKHLIRRKLAAWKQKDMITLVDFGVYEGYDMENRKVSCRNRNGYAAPEAYKEDLKDYEILKRNVSADVYALSSVIYRMVTGMNPVGCMERVFGESMRYPTECGVKMLREQEQILMKGMMLSEQGRFQSARDLYTELYHEADGKNKWRAKSMFIQAEKTHTDIEQIQKEIAWNTGVTREEVGRVIFWNHMENVPFHAVDVSEDKSGTIRAWAVKNGSLYDVYVAQKGGIRANNSSRSMFKGFVNMYEICNLEYLDTRDVYDMGWMFAGCSSLKSLDVSALQTGTVTDMYCMFFKCEKLQNLNLRGFDTRCVQNIGWMFGNCISLRELDLSTLRTECVTEMDHMFYMCKNLLHVNLQNINTSQVTNMESMFKQCRSLTGVNLGTFSTQKVKNMSDMFKECSSLRELDLSRFSAESAETVNGMFYGCRSLRKLNLDRFHTVKALNMNWMFYECISLRELNLASFNMEQVKDTSCMFYKCENLEILQFDKLKLLCAENVSWMFGDCKKLWNLNVKEVMIPRTAKRDHITINCHMLMESVKRKFENAV